MINNSIEVEPLSINIMSFDANKQTQRNQIDSDTWIQLLEEFNASVHNDCIHGFLHSVYFPQ